MNTTGWFLQQSPIDGLRRCRVEVVAETPARYRVRALAPGRGSGGGPVAAGDEFLIKKFQFTPDPTPARSVDTVH